MSFNSYQNLSEAIEELEERGFKQKYSFSDGLLISSSNDTYDTEELEIVEYHRFDSAANPMDSSVIFAIETTDGAKGTIEMNYSEDADMKIISFIDKVKIKTIPESVL